MRAVERRHGAEWAPGLWRRLYRDRWAYLFLLPSLGFFSVFFLAPVAWGAILSLLDYQLTGGRWAGLANYARVMSDSLFWRSLANNLYYAAGVVPLWLTKALVVAAIIFPFRRWLQNLYKTAFYLPHVTSAVIISMIWLWIYNPPFGLLNYLLHTPGFPWLGNRLTAMPALIAMQVVMGGGSTIVLISAAMGGIPGDYYEAAEIDGATRVQQFVRITLPLLKPTILYLLVMGTISSFQVFTNIYLMTRGGPQFSTMTIGYLIYETAFQFYDFGQASAMAMVLFAVIFAVALVQFRWLSTDVEY